MAKRISASLARIVRESRVAVPKVNPRVTAQRALLLLPKVRGGRRVLQQRKRIGGPVTLTQIAFFTPRTRSGNVGFIDFHNADLRAWSNDLESSYENDQVYFAANSETIEDDISLKHPNGVVQAFFDTEEEADLLVIAKLSSTGANIYLTLDAGPSEGQTFTVQGNGVDKAILKRRASGVHRVNIIQRRNPAKPLWFHSITVYQI